MSKVQYKDIVLKIRGYQVPGKQPMFFCVESGNFKIYIDKVGGEAPSPLEYLLASLAGCFNIVANIVSKEMGVAIENLEVDIEGVFNPEKLYTGKGERAGFKEIRVKVHVKSNAPRDVLEKWLKIVQERCPVSDNIAEQTPVFVTLEM
ncbi:MAG: OsmC family protein [Desulfurococcaceae archaeon]